jgi:ankyrin repeat protein
MKHILITTIAAVVLVGCGPKAPDISLFDAAMKGNIEAVKQHLAAGADVNAKDPVTYGTLGWTPLHVAAINGHKEAVELLIAKGADVNAKGSDDGLTPLHHAAKEGDNEVAELLIDKGANVNAKDDDGETPLDMAILFKHPETAELLRKHGSFSNILKPPNSSATRTQTRELLRKLTKTREELKAEGK